MSAGLRRPPLVVPSASVVVLVAALVAALLAGCTGGSTPGDKPSASAGPVSSIAPASLRVEVTHVAGRLSTSGRTSLATKIDRTLTSYAEAAFVGGRYPRSDFDRSFATFTEGAVTSARADEDLLTNKTLGRSTSSVRLRSGTAYLSVLAPKQRPAGVTAAVNWLFEVDRGKETTMRVRLHGRLMLTQVKAGRHRGEWRIFGYDVSRAASPGSGS